MNRARSSQEKKRNLIEPLTIALISLIAQVSVLALLSKASRASKSRAWRVQ